MTIKLSIIAAVARNSVIGTNQTIPWRIPSDFAWFKKTTMGKPLLMGRKQFETLPKPLVGRPHVIVTRQRDYTPAVPEDFGLEVLVAHDLDEGLRRLHDLAAVHAVDEAMILGGGDIYAQSMGHADRLYITHVDLEPAGDVVFPEIPPEHWQIVAEPEVPRSQNDEADYTVRIYERRPAPVH